MLIRNAASRIADRQRDHRLDRRLTGQAALFQFRECGRTTPQHEHHLIAGSRRRQRIRQQIDEHLAELLQVTPDDGRLGPQIHSEPHHFSHEGGLHQGHHGLDEVLQLQSRGGRLGLPGRGQLLRDDAHDPAQLRVNDGDFLLHLRRHARLFPERQHEPSEIDRVANEAKRS